MTETKLLTIFWHSPRYNSLTAGGYRRFTEIISRTPKGVMLDVVEASPSSLRSIRRHSADMKFYEVFIPNCITQIKSWFLRETLLRFIVLIRLLLYGYKLCLREHHDIVFVSNGDLIGLTIAFFFKTFLKANVAIDSPAIELPGETLSGTYSMYKELGLTTALIFTLLMSFSKVIAVLVSNRVDKIVAMSYRHYLKLRACGIKRPIKIVENGIDIPIIKTIPEQKKIYDGIFVGRHVPEKGIQDLLYIWKIVAKKIPNARLVLIGHCDESTSKMLEEKRRELRLKENILIYGEVSEQEKYKLLKQSKCLVFPSYLEAWGIVPLEALACGLPVVTYDLPVYNENIKKSRATFIAPKGNKKMLAIIVIELLNKDLRELAELSSEGVTLANQYDWHVVAEKAFAAILN